MTLRTKVSLLLTIIIAVALSVTGIFYLRLLETSLRNSIFDGLKSTSSTSSQLISRFLADTLIDTSSIAVALPKEALEQKNIPVIEERLRAFLGVFPKFENGMFILDENGRLLVDYPAYPDQRGKSFAFREYFKRTMEAQRGLISAPYKSARTGKTVLTFTAPLRGSSNQILGLVGCSVQLTSPDALEGIRQTRIGQSGYIYVYNKDRLMILHPQDERVLKKDVPVGANKLFDAAIEGFEGVGETVNSRGVGMLLSLNHIPGTDWILGAQQPKDEAFAPIREARRQIIASVLIAVTLAVIVAAIIITGITRPLLKLRKAVMLMGAAGETREGELEQNKDYRKELESIRQGGEIGDLTKAFLSISEQLDRTMHSLKNSARDWERTFDSVSDAIFILDQEGRIIRLNHSATVIIDKAYSEAIGRPISDFINEAEATDNGPFDKEGRAPDKIFTVELERSHSQYILEVTMTPLLDESDKRVGTVLVAKDITSRLQAEEEKKQLEFQLQQAQKMEAIGTLAGGIAHNFNNLLMGIQGNASLILLDMGQEHPLCQRAQNIEKLVQSGSRLTSQLLGYAREGRFEIRPISLNQIVRETGDTFALARKDIRVQREFADDLFGILADQGQIEQVLMNLYVNAADAMPNGGSLFLRTMNVTNGNMRGKPYEVKPGDYVLLSVRDTGIGMEKKTQERIFEPFFTTKSVGKGTGLGLASVYGIVKAHGGYIEVESGKGQGATFNIYLPACGEKVTREEHFAPELVKGKEKVLLVDDEDVILEVGEKILRAMGYQVLVAKSGTDAIEVYESDRDSIDLVLLDMVMPDMAGGETYDNLKSINPRVKVLLSSGYSIDGQAAAILKRGCNGFIQKPFNMEQLSHKIREVLI